MRRVTCLAAAGLWLLLAGCGIGGSGDRLSGGLCQSGDLDSACDYMVRFASAGFRAVSKPKD